MSTLTEIFTNQHGIVIFGIQFEVKIATMTEGKTFQKCKHVFENAHRIKYLCVCQQHFICQQHF